MRRIVAGCLIVACGLVVAAGASANRAHLHNVRVKPSSGGSSTRFTVSFRAPGRSGGLARRFEVRASGKGTGCAQGIAAYVHGPRKAKRVSVTLRGPWCAATYHGKIIETERPICAPHRVCPQFIIHLGTVGHFSFRVTGSGSTDTMPPTFAGLASAVQCFPGPMTPGEQQPVTLSWNAATDDVTPSSGITYDIYMSSTTGGENFASPSWTAQGVTSFMTPELPPGRFFVVRARDQAGNEDRNTVERQALNPCL
jgi:hypothetical protein